jgi:hypothetical protein
MHTHLITSTKTGAHFLVPNPTITCKIDVVTLTPFGDHVKTPTIHRQPHLYPAMDANFADVDTIK